MRLSLSTVPGLRAAAVAVALVSCIAAASSCGSAEGMRAGPEQIAPAHPNAEQRTVKTAPAHRATSPRVERVVLERGAPAPRMREPAPQVGTPELRVPDIREPEIDCTAHAAVGYRRGKPFAIEVVTIDGAPIERNTANAYLEMRAAAAKDGIELVIYSAFRSPEEQQYFYACYKTCSCNGCSQAAKPGYSNHQSGHALDIAIWSPEVHPWLVANAGKFGFVATVAKEPWHWEFRGKPSKSGMCRASTPAKRGRSK
jgi:hypothetical protein